MARSRFGEPVGEQIEVCPVTQTQDIIAGKWKIIILWNLSMQTRRFNDRAGAIRRTPPASDVARATALGPGEEAGQPIDTRAHDVALDVPNVDLHNGLPVTVHLRYALRLLPKEMAPVELYWSAEQRQALQIQIPE